MTENGDGPHKTAAVLPPVGKPFTPGYDGRRNAGGRPKGLAAAARAAVCDGQALIEFFSAVMHGDGKALGVRQISLAARMDAARWMADRGWGKAVTTIEMPTEPATYFTPEQSAALREMPPELKDGIRRWLEERREAYLARGRAAAEAKMRSYLPDQPDRNEPP